MKWKKYCWCRIPRSTGDEVCTVHCAELISPDRPGASSHANDGGVGKFLLTHEHGSLVKEMPREIWRRAKMRTKRICRFGKRRIYYYFHFFAQKKRKFICVRSNGSWTAAVAAPAWQMYLFRGHVSNRFRYISSHRRSHTCKRDSNAPAARTKKERKNWKRHTRRQRENGGGANANCDTNSPA